MKTLFHTDDLILPDLKLPNPCPISIQIKDKDIILRVGQRDWQWDLEDGHRVGCGTYLNPPLPYADEEAKLTKKIKE